MSWGKLDDKARGNAKLRAVGKNVRGALWMVWGYAAEQGTDGWVPDWVIANEMTAGELRLATTVKANGRAPLIHRPGDECTCLAGHTWTEEMAGYWIHDWLDYNPSRSENRVHRAKGKELKDKDLRHLINMRDGNACRYCGVVAPWADKRSPRALAIDHVDPTLAAGAANLVVACTSCNSRKKDARTPEAAGLTLLPPPAPGELPSTGEWPADTDPASIRREWPADQSMITLPITDPITDPIAIDHRSDHRSDPDPRTDPGPGHRPAHTSDDQAGHDESTSAGSDRGALPPGRGRDGSGTPTPPVLRAGDVGPAGQRPVIGPATTPRSADSPPTYRKSATSNPAPTPASPAPAPRPAAHQLPEDFDDDVAAEYLEHQRAGAALEGGDPP